MENNDQKISSNLLNEQHDLFVGLGTPGYLSDNAPDMDIEVQFMGAIKDNLREAKKHGLSRERVVERMNLCLPESLHITKRQLDAWCAESKEYHLFPAIYIGPFIWATRGGLSAIKKIIDPLDLVVMDRNEQLANRLGKSFLEKTKAENEMKLLKKYFGGM